MSGPTRGHVELEAWLKREYGTSRRTNRPVWSGIRRFVDDLNGQLAKMEPKSDSLPRLRTPTNVYMWLGTAKTHVCPGSHFRAAIELLSRGVITADSWDEPVEEPA